MTQAFLQHSYVRIQSLSFLDHIILLEQQLLELHLHVEVIHQDLFAGVAAVIDEEGHNGFGDGVIDVFLDYVEVRHDEALYHVCLGLFSEFWVVVDFDYAWHGGKHVAGQLVVLRKRTVEGLQV